MWKKWFPWRFLIRSLAQKQGFLDPVALLAKLQSFSQPSEVAAPVELIRLAAVLQARGLLNVQAIQHNLDWIWPYWVVRQFDPEDISFIPRAFSITHINLTHRNWTAAGIPDFTDYPLVDPRGLVTPFYDGWSLDAWIVSEDGSADLFPSLLKKSEQKWEFEDSLSVRSHHKTDHLQLTSRVCVTLRDGIPVCHFETEAVCEKKARLVIAARPFNAEGVSQIDKISLLEEGRVWEINGSKKIYLNEIPEGQYLSNYKSGDVAGQIRSQRACLQNRPETPEISCMAGMATVAAVFSIPAGGKRAVKIDIPLREKPAADKKTLSRNSQDAAELWKKSLEGHCELRVEDKRAQYLYSAAIRTLVLHTPGTETFPGPYTYKHFWFRDAAFILHALLAANLCGRAEKILDHFPVRQKMTGYFCSQDGEWDSNGQVLWIYRRFCELSGTLPKPEWKESIRKGVKWMERKRTAENVDSPHAGLFPSGFSAEHLGPNDFYYWDDFWGVEGFLSGAYLLDAYKEDALERECREQAAGFMTAIEKSLAGSAQRLNTAVMPSSPYRRLDTGSIGSLAVAYPLSLWADDDPRVLRTVDYLLENHFVNGGFFHDMSHSGINPYLTLQIAQILLKNADERFMDIVRAVRDLASGTGQWPEAIHPQTKGGCMGDGQHVWAAAEWVLMIRNCFVREAADTLILGSGVLPEWHENGNEIFFGPALTTFGTVTVRLVKSEERVHVSWSGKWRKEAPKIEVRVPGYKPVKVPDHETVAVLSKESIT